LKLITSASVLVLWCATSPAFAQPEGGRLNQRGWIQLGAFRPNIDSQIRYDKPSIGLTGTDLHLENELGLADRKTLPTLLLGARLGERWRMEFEHFSLKRNASRTLEAEVTFGDTTYDALATINSDFSSKVYRLSAGYSFLRTEDAEAGLALGVHVTDFRIALEGIGSVNGGPASVRSERQEKTVPLPTIGLYGAYAFAPSWELAGRLDLLSLKVRDYKGTLLNAQANLFYRFSPNVALGLGYRYDDYKLRASRDDWTGKVDYRFRGPQVVLDAGF
jgi:hypothetical protein